MKPATPLPWRVATQEQIVGVGTGNVIAKLVEGFLQDRAYIVHACNAYPRLVDALKKQINASGNDDMHAIHEGEALLRELGEL